MKRLRATVKRGKNIGVTLSPHRHKDGTFVVSHTRYKKDYKPVSSEAELPAWVAKGYSVRMSAPLRAPSLISPDSIEHY